MLFLFFLLLVTVNPCCATFEDTWKEMQGMYKQLSNDFQENNSLLGDYWQGQQKEIKNVLLGAPDKNIWKNRVVIGNMIREGFSRDQKFELCHISSCIHSDIYAKIAGYKDTDFNLMPFECAALNCSTNTLGHLYYVAKVLEKAKSRNIKLNTIVEFGAGYGNLTRIFKTLNKDVTLLLIDLPEFLAVQYLFLRSTLPDAKIIVHSIVPSEFEKGVIHLLPVSLADSIEYTADLFISNFALSESPIKTQEIIAGKKFYNASLVYVTGQLNGWNKQLGFATHHYLHNAFHEKFGTVGIHPFHIFNDGFESYEAMAYNEIK